MRGKEEEGKDAKKCPRVMLTLTHCRRRGSVLSAGRAMF
jgi:hypothetical protein